MHIYEKWIFQFEDTSFQYLLELHTHLWKHIERECRMCQALEKELSDNNWILRCVLHSRAQLTHTHKHSELTLIT